MMIAQKPEDLVTVWGCGESQQMTMNDGFDGVGSQQTDIKV